MRTIGGALVTAALAACSGNDGDHEAIARVYDACAPLSLVAAAPTTAQLDGMEAAQELWRARGAPAIGQRAGSAIEIRFEPASLLWSGQYDDEDGVIYVNRGLEDPGRMAIVIAHELGHAFGLEHVPASERLSLMNPGNLTVTPTDGDQRTLESLWGACGAQVAD